MLGIEASVWERAGNLGYTGGVGGAMLRGRPLLLSYAYQDRTITCPTSPP